MWTLGKNEVEIFADLVGKVRLTEPDFSRPLTYVRFLDPKAEIHSVRTENLRRLEERRPAPKPTIIWKSPRTGEEIQARQDFVNKLPRVLGWPTLRGREHAVHFDDVLSALGVDPQEEKSAPRQLRAAKEYLQRVLNIPVCSERSTEGGYFIAATADEILADAAAHRASAEGNLRAAEELEDLASRCFPNTLTVCEGL